MTAPQAQLDFLVTAGSMLEWHDNLDRNKPGLLEVSTNSDSCPPFDKQRVFPSQLTGVSQHGRATMSGLNDYDYQSLSFLKSDETHNLQQLRTVTKSAIPNEILEHFKRTYSWYISPDFLLFQSLLSPLQT